MEARARVLLAATLALLIGLVAAPSALAVSATVRVEGKLHQVAAATAVTVPAQGTLVDTDGTTYDYTQANALAALDRAAALRGFAYDFNTFYGTPFLEMVAGLEADPGDYSNGWTYIVNGVGWPILDMGAAEFPLQRGDQVVFTQNPDATFSRGAKLLRLRFTPGRGVRPGETVKVTVLGDDVAKANSAAEATRYGLDPVADPGVVEKPASFVPVVGATLHVGSRVYVDGADGDAADGQIAVKDLPRGTYAVWADMDMDASFSYVRSGVHRINVDFGPRVTSVRASATLHGALLATRVAFTLDKRCDARVRVFNRRGRVLAVMNARGLDRGRHTLAWRGRPAAALTSLVSFEIAATDSWGRVTTKSVPVRVTR